MGRLHRPKTTTEARWIRLRYAVVRCVRLVFAVLGLLLVLPGGPDSARAQTTDAGKSSEEATPWQKVTLPFEPAAVEVVTLDTRPGDEVLVIGEKGEVRVFRMQENRLVPWVAEGQLANPRATLYTVVSSSENSSSPGGAPDPDSAPGADGIASGRGARFPSTVFTLNDQGLHRLTFGGAAGEAKLGVERLTRRTRFALHTGAPLRSEFARDFNRDGLIDVLRPGPTGCEIWCAARRDDGSLHYRRSGRFPVEPSAYRQVQGTNLSDRLLEVFTIPDLELVDLDGNSREDLIVQRPGRRDFYLLSADGTFPEKPTASLDLSLFRDTSPRSGVELGKTLTIGDEAQVTVQDLDSDGIPDYVITHRRKLWCYLGTSQGPQFSEPMTILKVADDVTVVVIAPLDDDAWPDLLLFKLQLPTAASLLRGVFGSWDIALFALGYRNQRGQGFELAPEWKGEVRLRLPSIVAILKNPYALFEDFADVGSEFRPAITADLTGDGRRDLALLTTDQSGLEIWEGSATHEYPEVTEAPLDFQSILFEEDSQVWTLERLQELLGSGAQARVRRLTGGRAPTGRVTIPGAAPASTDVRSLDLDADGTAELLLQRGRELWIYRSK